MLGFDPCTKRFYINRNGSGKTDFNNDFAGIHYAPYSIVGNTISMHLFIDVSSIELFAENGMVVMTDLFFPTEDYKRFKIFTGDAGVTLKNAKIYRLKSIW